jgi:hypothetical protein
MKNFVAGLLMVGLCAAASAQIVCGPYTPFGRAQNPDGTWTISTYASCQVPDPSQWAHTYKVEFPSTITYSNGLTFKFVGSAVVEVQGHHDRLFREVRLVTVDSASLTDQNGNSLPVAKGETGTVQYPVDEWYSTTPLSPDLFYFFAASGTASLYSNETDTMVMTAVYQQVQTPSGGGDD